MNPDGINVAEVMAKSNIYLRIRTYGRAVIRLPETPESRSVLITIFRWSTEMRLWCVERLSRLSVNKANEALTEALVLGVTSGLDPEISQPFAATGTLHVLAVSGMHVGIIYGIILMALSPLAFWSGNRWTTAALGILLLWFYAFITGLSPSVLRAVVMFSLITAARPFGVRTNIWNTLAASAFLLILFDPFLITRVGFLLSYLAVAGIVWIAPMLKSHLESESRWLDWIWTTLCVTTAAQILTLPVTMSWFGKVPTYFLPANLFIIPLSTISLGLGLAGLALGDVHMCQVLIKFLLSHALNAMTQTAIFFEQLPGSVLEVTQISAFQGFLWVGIIVAFIAYVRWGRAVALVVSVFLAFICSMVDWKHRFEQTNEAILTVYHWPGKTFLALRANKSLMVMAPQNPLSSGADVPSDILIGVLRRSNDRYSFYPDSVGAARIRIGKNQWYYINGNVRRRLTNGVVILGAKGGSSLEDVCADVLIAASGTTVREESLAGCTSRIHRVARDGAYISRVPVSGAGDD